MNRPVILNHGPGNPHQPTGGGLIGVFVRHPTAPNLLMAVMIVLGVFSLLQLNRQFFPNIDLPMISVSVPWPGASAEDVETNILEVLEPELRFLDDVHEVTSIAREAAGSSPLNSTPMPIFRKPKVTLSRPSTG